MFEFGDRRLGSDVDTVLDVQSESPTLPHRHLSASCNTLRLAALSRKVILGVPYLTFPSLIQILGDRQRLLVITILGDDLDAKGALPGQLAFAVSRAHRNADSW